jgi:hypothetical protein
VSVRSKIGKEALEGLVLEVLLARRPKGCTMKELCVLFAFPEVDGNDKGEVKEALRTLKFSGLAAYKDPSGWFAK